MEKWTKVEDGLPEDNVVVLGVVEAPPEWGCHGTEGPRPKPEVMVILYDSGPALYQQWFRVSGADWGEDYYRITRLKNETVTHWMPRPELPSQEGDV